MNTEKQVLIYQKITESNTDDFKRVEQARNLSKVLDEHFKFDSIECIETGASQNFSDGCFGFFLCEIIKEYGGTFKSVDIDESISISSVTLYDKFYSNLTSSYKMYPSVTFPLYSKFTCRNSLSRFSSIISTTFAFCPFTK